MVSAYERQRLHNIERNAAKLAELELLPADIGSIAEKAKRPKLAAARRPRARCGGCGAPARRSRRTQQQPAVVYSADQAEDDRAELASQQRAQQQSGHRLADGRWRGEGFGAVAGVAVGAVFGAGDFQRKGRFEMSGTGFHSGHVQPEWLDPSGGGVWSLVLNNVRHNAGQCKLAPATPASLLAS